ncbi:MAG TPA: RDD family protein, partial [Gemmatimonadales bacterium]|nr:RDD family protein [Gemmatimonadales bacterium]
MDAARDPIRTQFSRRLAIETPEHVVVELELAGLGSRLAAAVLDGLVLFFLLLIVNVVLAALAGVVGRPGGAWVAAAAVLLNFLAFWGYFLLFEALNGGRTPGKKYLGIRVVMDTGHPVTFGAAAVRNLIRVVDAQPLFTYLVGLGFVLVHAQNKRLGDLVAGTIVVRDRPHEARLAVPVEAAEAEPVVEAGVPELSDDEYRLLSQFLERLDALEPALRLRLTTDLAARFAPRFPRRPADPEAFLVQLYAAEHDRRRGRLATRAATGTGRTAVVAERFVARKQAAWEEFRRLAARVERTGLANLSPSEIPAFAARYREVAADLARARTYGVDARVLEYLERVVTAGHNAIYGLRGRRRWSLSAVVLRDFPAAVMAERSAVLLALALFAVPAVAGYFVIRERPEAAYEFLPEQLIARAEAGVRQAAEGTGYAETPDPFLPIVATRIIANNVQVAFGAFAFGITAGLGTLFVLVSNGLFIGMVLGLFANYGLADWLLTFVAGHGVLELAAI